MKHIWMHLLLIVVMGTAHAQDRPNVVVILADNVGYGDIGAYGAGEIRGMPTPRIDHLVRPESARRTGGQLGADHAGQGLEHDVCGSTGRCKPWFDQSWKPGDFELVM